MIEIYEPKSLQDLYAVFEALEKRPQTIALVPSTAGTEMATPPARSGDSWFGVFSSGTTGRPKLAWHSWLRLKSGMRSRTDLGSWGSPFLPYTFAGVQAALCAWNSSVAAYSLPTNPQEGLAVLRQFQIEALSCTPTYVDMLMQEPALQPSVAPSFHLKQITLGGEILRRQTGRRLAHCFPGARKSIVYATSELGELMTTHRLDGWYEAASLQNHTGGWRITTGILEVQRNGQWASTGDLAECGRLNVDGEMEIVSSFGLPRREHSRTFIRIVGRADAVANIAGTKVNLDQIVSFAESIPGVRRAAAVGRANPVTGQVVSLRFAVEQGYLPGGVRASLERAFRSELPKEAWPREWELDSVAPGINGKRSSTRTAV